MSLITAFESFSPKSEGEDGRRSGNDYGVALGALAIDLPSAEVVFSSCAKRRFLSALKDIVIKRQTAQEFGGQVPCWVMSGSAAVKVVPKSQCTEFEWNLQLERLCPVLDQLVLSAASFVFQHAHEGQTLVLVDALGVSIKAVGTEVFSFQVKQRWGQAGG